MPSTQNAPWGALPPGALAEVVAVLSAALAATLTDARRLQRVVRNADVESVHRVESADVETAAILARLTQASADVATIPGVWQLLHGADAVPPSPPPPDWADAWRSVPDVLDMDAAIHARQRAEARGDGRRSPLPPRAGDRPWLDAEVGR